ncbi:MAG: SpoIIE family protein phosphatase [Acidobacteria bacterium]|nr:SpoIIE family protein phosphatase [Acidobacteriota bacterium]
MASSRAGGRRPGARVAHVVLVEQPVGEAAFEMRRQAASMVGLAVVLVVALAGMTVVATRRAVTAPLEAVAEAAHCLRGGVRPSREILARIGRRRDEIGSLARHFDVMAGELLSRHEALEAAVQERTRSLKAANGRIRASQARFESDLRVAQEVQAALAPEESWTVGDLEIRCRMAPARRLSGDFLNVQRRSGDVFAAVSDVSGKGLGAALFMAVSQTVLTGAAGRQRSVSALLADANVRLCRRNPVGMFVTSFAACAVPGQGLVQFSCAGHEAPFLLSPDGAVCRLPRQDNVALGVDPESSFVSVALDLDPGQTLVAFTDGVTDALNASGEPFGEERLQALLEAFPPRGGVDDLVEAVWTGTAEFAAGAEAADDKTLLVLHRRPPGGLGSTVSASAV